MANPRIHAIDGDLLSEGTAPIDKRKKAYDLAREYMEEAALLDEKTKSSKALFAPISNEFDPAMAIAQMQVQMDAHHESAFLKKIDDADSINGQIETLAKLMGRLNSARGDKTLDLSKSAEDRALVDAARKVAPHLFEEGKYSFEQKEIDPLYQSVSQESQRLSNLIPALLNRAEREMQLSLQLLRLNEKTGDAYNRMIERMVSRQRVQ